MSTTKPRITVTLEPRTHEVLSRLSAASGESMSQIVAGFVDLAIPSLERVVVVLERAKAAPQEIRAGLAAAIERADQHLLPTLLNAAGQVHLFLSDMDARTAPAPGDTAQPGRQAKGRAARTRPKVGGEGESTPVPVTRGSGGGKTLTQRRRHGPL